MTSRRVLGLATALLLCGLAGCSGEGDKPEAGAAGTGPAGTGTGAPARPAGDAPDALGGGPESPALRVEVRSPAFSGRDEPGAEPPPPAPASPLDF